VEIVGDPSTDADNYFAAFQQRGVWKEIAKPGIPVAFNAATMPHVLVRESDGTFTFKRATWGNRVAGDLDTAPDPSFVGARINEAFLLRNRLGFLSNDDASLSRAREFFEFYVASATALTDADPIDEPATHTKAVTLRHAVPFRKRMFFFADEAQFELQYGGTTLSSETAEIVPVFEYKGAPGAKPVGADKSLFFPVVRDATFGGIMEAIIEEGTVAVTDAKEITAHVPSYVRNPRKLAASANEGVLLALADTAPRSLWVYRSRWTEQTKLQSAWSRWDYYGDDPNSGIINVDFVDDVCFVLAYQSDGLYLERFSVAPKQVDPGWTSQFKLDRRADESACALSYDPISDHTTITTPWIVSAKTRLVARFPDDHTKKPGSVANITYRNANTLIVTGDWSAAKFYVGEVYRSYCEPSKQFLRKSSSGGGQEIVGTGRLQMLFWTFHFANTGEFEIEVTPHKVGTTYVQPVSGFVLGTPDAVIGSVPIVSGEQRVGIGGRNTEARVAIVNESHLPFHVLSIDWEGNYVAKSRRLAARHKRRRR
jgi:hypothetical protein